MNRVDKTSRVLADIRCAYLVVYVAIYALMYCMPLAALNSSLLNFAWSAMSVIGLLLMAVDFFCGRTWLKTRLCGLLLLFLAAELVSVVLNARYGVMGNIKAMLWLCVQFFVLATVDTELPEQMHKKHLRLFMEAFGVIWFALALWSLGTFVALTHESLYIPSSGESVRVGFWEGRLHGIFEDPNYASLCSAAAIVFAVTDWRMTPSSRGRKIFCWAQVVVQLSYIVLAYSRTIFMAILAALILLAIVLGLRWADRREAKGAKRLLLVAAAVVSICAGAVAVFFVLRMVLACLPGVYTVIRTGDIHAFSVVSLRRPDVSDTDDLTNNRMQIYLDYLKLIGKRPLFGVPSRAAGTFMRENFPDSFVVMRGYSVHSGYLALFVYAGLVGGVFAMAWLVMVAVEVVGYLIRRRNSGEQSYWTVLSLTMFLVVAAVAALPLEFMFSTNMIFDVLFWVTLGYVRSFVRMSEPERYTKLPIPYRVTEWMAERFGKKRLRGEK